MKGRLRKFWLAIHIAVSVGWLGAVVAYVALDITAATSDEILTLRAAYIAMGAIAGYAILPLAIVAVATGLIVSLGTPWGLFRHYWVLISFLLTSLALLVLLSELRVIGSHAAIASDPGATIEDLLGLGSTLVHSVGGLVVLSVVLVLNLYKPRGMTRYGWRKTQMRRGVPTGVQ